jgi:CHAT domain-containing protein
VYSILASKIRLLGQAPSAQPYLGLTHRGSFAHRLVASNACAIVGTLWPVEGGAANEFAAEFYKQIASKPIGLALLAAKTTLLNFTGALSGGKDDNVRERILYRQVAVRSYCLFASPDLRLVKSWS